MAARSTRGAMPAVAAAPAPTPAQAPTIQVPRPIVRSARTSELVAASIRAQVARGELHPGDRFPAEDELMEVFGIARTTLREALRILESEGLVTVLRGRNGGPRVTSPSIDHIARMFGLLLQIEGVALSDIYTARSVIEPHLAHMLATHRSPEALAALSAVIDSASAAAEADDGEAFGEAAGAMHETMVEHAGNASLAIFAQLLHEVVTQSYRRAGKAASSEQRRRAVRSYRKFYRLIEAGDAEGAEAHWRRHMSYSGEPAGQDRIDLFPRSEEAHATRR